MPVPPLHHGVGGAGIDRVRLEPTDRDRQVVDHVQHGNHHDERAEEPVADIDVVRPAFDHRGKEHDAIGDPDHSHPQGAGELYFGVFLGGGVAQRQADQHDHDYRLPAPESEGREAIAEQPHLAGTLHRIIAGGKLRAAGKAEDHKAGVQRAQPAEGGPGQVQVHVRPDQLRGDPYAHGHADNAPDHRHHDELADHLVVIGVRRL
ncbi:hypothetical protein D3C80_1510210 [compost metagenome]